MKKSRDGKSANTAQVKADTLNRRVIFLIAATVLLIPFLPLIFVRFFMPCSDMWTCWERHDATIFATQIGVLACLPMAIVATWILRR